MNQNIFKYITELELCNIYIYRNIESILYYTAEEEASGWSQTRKVEEPILS